MKKDFHFFVRVACVLIIITADAALNSSRILEMNLTGVALFAWLSVAIAAAACPSIISLHGDRTSAVLGVWTCLASFALSCWAVNTFVESTVNYSNSAAASIAQEQAKKSSLEQSMTTKRKVCATKPIEVCDSIKLEEKHTKQIEAISDNISKLEALKPISKNEENIMKAILIMIAFTLPVMAAELSRQIGFYLRKPLRQTAVEPELNIISEPKPEPKTVPRLGTMEQKPEPKKKGAGTRKKITWTNAQKEMLENRYLQLIEQGIKPTAAKVQEGVTVQRQVCQRWFKEGAKPNIKQFEKKEPR